MSAAEFLREQHEQEDEPGDHITIGVLPENELIVRVFQQCEIPFVMGFGCASWQDITAREIRSAVALMDVPRRDWPRVIEGVQIMSRITTAIRNAAIQEKQARNS